MFILFIWHKHWMLAEYYYYFSPYVSSILLLKMCCHTILKYTPGKKNKHPGLFLEMMAYDSVLRELMVFFSVSANELLRLL